jgi:hypothetical protein
MIPYSPPLPRTDGAPRRAHACLNVRREEKRVVDHLQSYWSLRSGRELAQADAFSIVLAAALRSGLLDVPRELAEDESFRVG